MSLQAEPKPQAYPRPSRLLREIIDLATLVLGARYGALGVLNAERTAFSRFIPAGSAEDDIYDPGPMPEGWGPLDSLIRDPRPLRMRVPEREEPPVLSFLGVPLVSSGRVRGALCFAEKEKGAEFRPSDERLAECFGRLAVDVLDGAKPGEEVKICLARYRSVLEEDGGAAIITNPSREIIFWNEGARRLFGYTEDEALGRPCADLLAVPEARMRWRRGFDPHVLRLFVNGSEVQRDGFRCHKSGRKIQVRVLLSPVCHRVAGIVAITVVGKYRRI